MATLKNLVLRKEINGVLYDLMVKTVADQVYTSENISLTAALANLKSSVDEKAATSDLTALETRFNALIQDAPEAYDTLKEIANYISTHTSEYEALLAISNKKVDKVDGMGLSHNDLTDELAQKLNDIYDKATLDEKFNGITERLSAVEAATGNPKAITAADVSYTSGEETMTVADALDQLMYKDMTISMSVSAATTQEVGATVNDLVVNWTYSKSKVTSQSLNGVNLTDLNQRSYTETQPITANKTYTLKANDGKKDFTKSVTISFQRKVYWGVGDVASAGAVNSEFVLGLSGSKFAGSKSAVGTISANAGAGQYIYYVQPATWADPVFNIGGFDTEFEKLATFDFTNASGDTTSYNVFKSGQAGLGSTSMAVK